MPMKGKIFELIDGGEGRKTQANRIINTAIIVLIILSVVEIILESFQELNSRFFSFFTVFEYFTVAVFTLEYLLRLWTADLKYPNLSGLKARGKFIFSAMGLVDLLAIMPFYLPFLFKFDWRFIRILRVVRLLRILKLNRYTKALGLVGNVFYEKKSELAMTISLTFILLLISSTIMYNLENEVQPEQFPNILATFWWAIATLTTVGYGDVYPVTGLGKLVSGIIALLGVGLVALPTGILSAGFIDKIEGEKAKDQREEAKAHHFCPHCGKSLKH